MILDTVRGGVAESSVDVVSKVQQTMIFVNTASEAALLADLLRKSGLENAEYHKCVTDPVRRESLRRFREEEVSVLVCTDHAARGLDLPNVRHIIQAEFATNVVTYLHRIGRASRAGVIGKATNIYDSRTLPLVESILSDQSEDKKVDQSFSRRRGFRKKIKRSVRSLDEILNGTDGGGDGSEGEEEVEGEVESSSALDLDKILIK